MSRPDTKVGTIGVLIETEKATFAAYTDLLGTLQVKGETIDDLSLAVDLSGLRREIASTLRQLAKHIANPRTDLAQMFEREME